MKIMITGHRPQKLGGFGSSPTQIAIKAKLHEILTRAIKKYGKENIEIISGMALGVDQWWCEAAQELGLDVAAYIPFPGQESNWPESSKRHYVALLSKCKRVKVCCQGSYSARKMQIRNEVMVDNADVCVAIWDGSSGGTGNCVHYIRGVEKPFLIVDPFTLAETWENLPR